MDGLRTEVCGQQKQSNDPHNNHHNLNYWVPLTRKRHTMPRPAQPQHTNHWAANAEKTPAGAPAATAHKKQQPDATCEGKNG